MAHDPARCRSVGEPRHSKWWVEVFREAARRPVALLADTTKGLAVLTDAQLDVLAFDERGLIPAVVQQHDTGEVLMVAWMDAPALERTLQLGEAVFYSRSRREQWHKGATSGNTQRVLDLRIDCDGDVLLVLVDQQGDGVACHTGQRSCFHRRLPDGPDGPPVDAAPPLAT